MPSVVKSTGPAGTKPQQPPRVLVVDDEQDLRELIGDVARDIDCRIMTAATLAEARGVIASQDVDVLVIDVHLPDGDGLTLLPALHHRRPTASAIVVTGTPSVEKAVTALRHGAVDFLAKPFTQVQLTAHIRAAVARHVKAAGHARKFDRLRSAVKRLNESRRLISKKVDILCNDLVSAYGELSRQLDAVRDQEGFRKAIADSQDLEQLLCHAMDWVLRQIGYCNVAVWLAGEDGDFQLGAYMKYTLAGEPPLTDVLKRVVLPMAATDAGPDGRPLHVRSADLKKLTAPERKLFGNQDVLAAHCTYLGEGLAGLVFFRDESSPFTEEDEQLLQAVAPIFALSLASVVRDAATDDDDEDADPDVRGDDESPGAAEASDPGATPDRDQPRRPDEKKGKAGGPGNKPAKPDPADWWKRGEPPPF